MSHCHHFITLVFFSVVFFFMCLWWCFHASVYVYVYVYVFKPPLIFLLLCCAFHFFHLWSLDPVQRGLNVGRKDVMRDKGGRFLFFCHQRNKKGGSCTRKHKITSVSDVTLVTAWVVFTSVGKKEVGQSFWEKEVERAQTGIKGLVWRIQLHLVV